MLTDLVSMSTDKIYNLKFSDEVYTKTKIIEFNLNSH